VNHHRPPRGSTDSTLVVKIIAGTRMAEGERGGESSSDRAGRDCRARANSRITSRNGRPASPRRGWLLSEGGEGGVKTWETVFVRVAFQGCHNGRPAERLPPGAAVLSSLSNLKLVKLSSMRRNEMYKSGLYTPSSLI